MAVSGRRKRKLVVNDLTYLWFVLDEYDQFHFDGLHVKVVAIDRSLYAEYGLAQRDDGRHIWAALEINAQTEAIPCERLETLDGVMASSGVRKLVDHCLNVMKARNP